jgi:predicted dehydrogenase
VFGAVRGASVAEAIGEGIDVLHVCTPNASYAECSRAALEAGVAVV